MARPLRIEFPGALYHVTSRGNAREPIFFGDVDRESFLRILGDAIQRCHWVCHAYCLMPNHYHLLVETPEVNLSRGMRQINGVYYPAVQPHPRAGSDTSCRGVSGLCSSSATHTSSSWRDTSS